MVGEVEFLSLTLSGPQELSRGCMLAWPGLLPARRELAALVGPRHRWRRLCQSQLWLLHEPRSPMRRPSSHLGLQRLERRSLRWLAPAPRRRRVAGRPDRTHGRKLRRYRRGRTR